MRAFVFNKQRKIWWLYLVVCGIVCMVVLIPVLLVNAAPTITSHSIDTLQKQEQQINQQRTGVIQERDRLSNMQQAAQDHLKGLQQNLQTTNTQIQDSELRLRLASEHLKNCKLI